MSAPAARGRYLTTAAVLSLFLTLVESQQGGINGTIPTNQRLMTTRLLTAVVTNNTISFNSQLTRFSDEDADELLDTTEWSILGTLVSFGFCSADSQHGRRSVVRRVGYTLYALVDPETRTPGNIEWQFVDLVPPSSNSTNSSFRVCEGSTDGATFNFRSVSGFDQPFRSLHTIRSPPEQSVGEFSASVCLELRRVEAESRCTSNAPDVATTNVYSGSARDIDNTNVVDLDYEVPALLLEVVTVVALGLEISFVASTLSGANGILKRDWFMIFIVIGTIIFTVWFSTRETIGKLQDVREVWMSAAAERAWQVEIGQVVIRLTGLLVGVDSHVASTSKLVVLPIILIAAFVVALMGNEFRKWWRRP